MIDLVEGPLDVGALLASVADPEHGGSALFVGTTRREEGIRALVALEYEAYPELARAEMRVVCEEAAARYGARAAVVHRVGRVAVGEPAVAVAASAPGRAGAFAATRHVIDQVKRRAPIWKRAVYADGGERWLPGAPDPRALSTPSQSRYPRPHA